MFISFVQIYLIETINNVREYVLRPYWLKRQQSEKKPRVKEKYIIKYSLDVKKIKIELPILNNIK